MDRVAMGTGGRRGVNRVPFDSIAEEVARRVPRPVLTVQADSPSRAAHPVRPMVNPGGLEGGAAAREGTALARGAQWDLLHMVEEMVHPSAN